ncbi:MAG: phosphoribosylanthranilate isomerase [Lewinellaceae bacterium]|nr:phosphoribosylanthranilate isomerase [Lewinellaceae bacterium]
MTTRVKICCIRTREEAREAIAFGAAAVGLVGNMPSGPGVIADSQIADIARSIPPGVASFLLTSETEAPAIIRHQQRVHTNTLQLVDRVAPETYAAIRRQLPAVKIVQVIHVLDEQSVDEALAAAAFADALLLDSGNPNLAVKVLGGTGQTHDWRLSKKIRAQVSIPVFLAGGLTPENARAAIESVEPYGLDICSGVRTNENLDLKKLEKFFAAIRA